MTTTALPQIQRSRRSSFYRLARISATPKSAFSLSIGEGIWLIMCSILVRDTLRMRLDAPKEMVKNSC